MVDAQPNRPATSKSRNGLAGSLNVVALPALAGFSGARIGGIDGPILLQGWLDNYSPGPVGPINLFAFLAAIAIVFIAWQAWSRRPRVANVQERPSTTVPDVLHPAFAGALASGNVNDALMEATILDLARRGAIQIEPDTERDGDVQIRLIDTSLARHDFETTLLGILERRASGDVVGYRRLGRLRSDWGPARQQLRRALEERDWFNPRARQNKLPLVAGGSIGLVLAVALIVAAITLGSGWPVLGALVLAVVGILVLGMGNIYPSTTAAGEADAIKWRGFRTGLARARMDPDVQVDLDDAFPFIVAFNMAATYNRILRRSSQTGYVPAWLGPDADVSTWPDGWHDYWTSLHAALAPTDTANTRPPGGTVFQRWVTGGRR